VIFPSRAVADRQAELVRTDQTDRLYYCYRCFSCGRLITKLEVLAAREADRINLCPCGSRTVRPTNAKIWEELLLPRCWKLIYAIRTHRISGPPEMLTPQAQGEADRKARKKLREFRQTHK
jgi:DNA-directed RNA polymerase subunit RPC12/RpoP